MDFMGGAARTLNKDAPAAVSPLNTSRRWLMWIGSAALIVFGGGNRSGSGGARFLFLPSFWTGRKCGRQSCSMRLAAGAEPSMAWAARR